MKYTYRLTDIEASSYDSNAYPVRVEHNGEVSTIYITAKNQKDAEIRLASTGWYSNSSRTII